jgi:hypothetical protein
MNAVDTGPWFEFAPRSEQEVVVLFGLLLPRLKRRFLINEVKEQFPDCHAYEINGSGERKLVKIEFELRASNFAAHKHPEDRCDLIVCWEDDWPNCKIERLSLKAEVAALEVSLIQSPNRVKYPPQIWTYDTFLSSVSDHPDLHREFLDWAVALRGNSSVTFGEGNQFPSWSFNVCLPSGTHVTLFGVYPDDTIWLQPQSLPDPLGGLYRESLKSVVDEREFTKQWFYRKNAIQDVSFIVTLKRAVQKVLGAQQPGSSF